jgi:hypothetical protein
MVYYGWRDTIAFGNIHTNCVVYYRSTIIVPPNPIGLAVLEIVSEFSQPFELCRKKRKYVDYSTLYTLGDVSLMGNSV